VTRNPAVSHGGDRVAQALHAHGVPCIYTLCGGHISPILAAAKARASASSTCATRSRRSSPPMPRRGCPGRPGVAAVTAGPGISNTITALKNAQLAQSPLLLLGGAAPTALQGRGALQDIDQRPLVAPHVKRFIKMRRVRDLGPAVAEALELAQSACPARCSSNARSTCCTTKPDPQWYADAGGKGTALPERALRWYLNRHAEDVRRQRRTRTRAPRVVDTPRPDGSAVQAAAPRWRRPNARCS
jgi:hypothetical protein